MNGTELVRLASDYWKSAALTAAVRLDVFVHLADGPLSAARLAESAELSVQHTEALLDALVGLELLDKTGERYGLSEELRPYLDPASPDSLLPAFGFNADLFDLWGKLDVCVKTGNPVLPGNPHLGQDEARMKRFVEGMHSRASIMAREVLASVALPEAARVLDVGGGPGTLSVKLLERDRDARSTVLDLPPVVAAAAALHAGNPVLERLEFLGGDYHSTAFPADQDVIFYCGALHQEPEAVVSALFERMRDALKPGGRLYCVDLFVDDSRTRPDYSALFQLNMMLMRPASRVHRLNDVAEQLTRCGLTGVEAAQLPNSLYGVVKGTRP